MTSLLFTALLYHMTRTLSLVLAFVLALLAPTHALVASSSPSHSLATRAHHQTTETTKTTSLVHVAGGLDGQAGAGATHGATHGAGQGAGCGGDAECAALDAAHGWHSDGTPGGARERMALDEDDPRWVCWLDGNRTCSTTPLDGR